MFLEVRRSRPRPEATGEATWVPPVVLVVLGADGPGVSGKADTCTETQ